MQSAAHIANTLIWKIEIIQHLLKEEDKVTLPQTPATFKPTFGNDVSYTSMNVNLCALPETTILTDCIRRTVFIALSKVSLCMNIVCIANLDVISH